MRLAIALCALMALPAAAREVTPDDRAAVAALIADFEEALEIGDFPGLIGFIPPQMISTIAGGAGIPEEDLLEIMIAGMAEAMEAVTFESFGMALDAATEGETAAGRPYMMIPTTSVMQIEEMGRVTATSTTLALQDGDRWLIARIDNDQQLDVLRRTFPDFEGIAFPAGTMEVGE